MSLMGPQKMFVLDGQVPLSDCRLWSSDGHTTHFTASAGDGTEVVGRVVSGWQLDGCGEVVAQCEDGSEFTVAWSERGN